MWRMKFINSLSLCKKCSSKRLAKGKCAPGLLIRLPPFVPHLPCKHIFHEHIYVATRLLTANAWRTFQEVFKESGFEVYEEWELVMVDVSEQTEEKRAENRRLAVNELTERLRHKYYGVEERGGAGQAEKLETPLNPIINDPNAF